MRPNPILVPLNWLECVACLEISKGLVRSEGHAERTDRLIEALCLKAAVGEKERLPAGRTITLRQSGGVGGA
jgi:hypothetical protein